MKRTLYNEDHEMFRDAYRKFIEREIEPYYEQWEKDGIVSRDLWLKAGEAGFLCPWLPEEFGGSGVDFLYSVVMVEAQAGMGFSGFAANLHNDIVVPYLWNFGSDEQKKRP